jgi:TolB-like protein/Flp pilus assembly protein TadD
LSGTSHAVFLSYASQDAEAAQKICETLRVAGIEVWFDQSELRGGDAWDQSIRKQIKTCALFVPIISKHTHERAEGYFRLEWKLAVDRSHLITSHKAFLLPVVIDETSEEEEHVPDRFREVQWTRLPGGVTPGAFVERVRRLLSGEPAQGPTGTPSDAARVPAAPSTRKPALASWRLKAALLATLAVLGYLVANRLAPSKRGAEVGAASAPAAQSAPATAFNPPPHSIAVLPFVNLSGDKEQEYFSDGLTEELLNSLADIDGLQVAARTSSFSFKEHPDIATVAHKLNVSAVLEGSVRRSGHTVRIAAQLIDAVSGFHLWSKTYDRDLGNVLKLQTEIATAVATTLRVTLLGDVGAKIELGGTRNPAAFDAYLRASKGYQTYHDPESLQAVIATFTEAIRLDPGYALASAGRSLALAAYADSFATGPAIREYFDKALADASQTIRLAPELAEGHLALAVFSEHGKLDFTQASAEFERALALAPGNAQALSSFGRFAVYMGRTDAGIAASRHAVTLDPLNPLSRFRLAYGLFIARHYAEAVAAFDEVLALDSQDPISHALRGIAFYELGDFEQARASCEADSDAWVIQFCLALAYDKLGRHTDADAVLTGLRGSQRDARAYEYAVIYAQREEPLRALEWLDTAVRLRNSRLALLKTDPLMDPLRKERRFQAIERELKFP